MLSDRLTYVLAKAREVDAIDTEIKGLLALRLNKHLNGEKTPDLDVQIDALLKKQEAIVEEITQHRST